MKKIVNWLGFYNLDGKELSEFSFSSIVEELFQDQNAFDNIKFEVQTFKINELGEQEEDLTLNSQNFSSIEAAKSYDSLSQILTTEQATAKVVDVFNLTSLTDVYNYDPIAQNNIEVQSLNAQLENLYSSIPFFIDDMSSSNDVLEIMVDRILSSGNETIKLDLGNQEDLELVFEVDNSPTEEGGQPPNILKQLASTNKKISDATTIEDQVAGKMAQR